MTGALRIIQWRCGQKIIDLTRPVVMGVLNVTPDSFYDGGRYCQPGAAVDRAAAMIREGAGIVDVGGESTRPGSAAVSEAVEMERVLPVIERLKSTLDVPISIDTSKPGVMAAAANAGACIVNDVHALRAHGARAWAAEAGVGVCLMHMQGEPRTMQHNPVYQDVVAEVCEFLTRERAACIEAGIAREAIVLDPGVGFGKGFEHNMALFKALPRIAALGSPLLVGVSRKSFIGRLLEPSPIGAGIEASAPSSSAAGRSGDERLYGGIALAALAVSMGARIVRTHDVAATYDALRVVSAVLQ